MTESSSENGELSLCSVLRAKLEQKRTHCKSIQQILQEPAAAKKIFLKIMSHAYRDDHITTNPATFQTASDPG